MASSRSRRTWTSSWRTWSVRSTPSARWAASRSESPGLLESVEACRVRPRDAPALVLGHAGEDALQDLARARERRLRVRVVRAPHQRVDADEVAVADAEAVLLEAQEDVPPEEVARQGVALEPVPAVPSRALRVRVVQPVQEVGRPRHLVLGGSGAQPRVALED